MVIVTSVVEDEITKGQHAKLIECSRIDCKFIKSRGHSEGEGTIYETKENIKEVEGELRVF